LPLILEMHQDTPQNPFPPRHMEVVTSGQPHGEEPKKRTKGLNLNSKTSSKGEMAPGHSIHAPALKSNKTAKAQNAAKYA
jgi:hypothetical protein